MGFIRKHYKKNKNIIIKNHQCLDLSNLEKEKFTDEYVKSVIKFGNIDKFYSTQETLDAFYSSENHWDSLEFFFFKKYNVHPVVFRVDERRLDKKFIKDFFEYLQPPENSFKSFEQFGEDGLTIISFTILIEVNPELMDLSKKIIMNFESSELTFYVHPSLVNNFDKKENPFRCIMSILASYTTKTSSKNKIYVVYKDDYGFEKKAFDIKNVNVNIEENYNDDFKDISDQIIKNLNNTKSGLYILSGIHGSGKTTYIRYLTGKIKRKIIFISPDMVDHITDPSFIPFLMDNSDSVLIIEDAEPALKKRGDDNWRSGSVSNILNLTDGLLSDCLNISIVATFNTDSKNIDEAILRDGRLINSYKFEKLSWNKASSLLEKRGIDISDTDKKDMTLAEIYNYENRNNSNETFKVKTKKIGFKNE